MDPFSYTTDYQPCSGLFLFLGLILFTCQNWIQLKSLGGGIVVVILAIVSSVAALPVGGLFEAYILFTFANLSGSELFEMSMSNSTNWPYVVS